MPRRVLIVGGGLIGSSIAWRLAQAGIPAAVADAGDLGGEASPAGAGMLSPGSEADKASSWLDLGVASLRLYASFAEELHTETGIDVAYRVCGCLVMDEAEREERAVLHQNAGIRVEERADGLFYPDDAQVDPAQLLRALRCAAEARGVVFERRSVTGVEAGEQAALVVAAGAWSGGLGVTYRGHPVALPETDPVKGHLIGFDMPQGTLGPFLRRGSAYVLQRTDGLLIAGSNEERVGFDTRVNVNVCKALHREAAALVPALAAMQPSRRWIGFRPALRHGDGPRIGRVEGTNVWLAYGHYRNGILLTPLTAERVAGDLKNVLRGA